MPARYQGEIDRVLISMKADGQRTFTTKDFIERFKKREADAWEEIEAEYGRGGKGAKRHFSSFSLISQYLRRCDERGELNKIDFVGSPDGWGSPAIARWSFDEDAGIYISPEEQPDEEEIWEGAVTRITVNRYERKPVARRKCIEHYGAVCVACGMDFGEMYGERGEGIIHVHHLKPIHEIRKAYKVDPIKDLRPVCPNCHVMIHAQGEMLSIARLKKIIRQAARSAS